MQTRKTPTFLRKLFYAVIMTELDKIIKPLNNGKTIKFYHRYTDDPLNTFKVLIKCF